MADTASQTSMASIPSVLLDGFRNAIGQWSKCRPRSFSRRNSQHQKVEVPTTPKPHCTEKDPNHQKPPRKILFFDSDDIEKRRVVEQVKLIHEHNHFVGKLGKTGVLSPCVEGGVPGIVETPIAVDRRKLSLCDIGSQRPLLRSRDWAKLFENVTGIVFVVNLANYDEILTDDPAQTRLMQALYHFEVMINSPHLRDTSIDLFMSNAEEFKRKLVTSPLEEYFPDYEGGRDVMKAAKYLLSRFVQTNCANLRIYPHLLGRDATASSEVLFTAVKQMALQGTLSEFKLLEKDDRAGRKKNGR